MSDPKAAAGDARRRNDTKLIEDALDTPSQGGRSGGTLQRDIATQAEEEHLVDGKTGVTRVRKADKKR